MSEPLVLGVDVGTTATKSVLFGPAGVRLGAAATEYPLLNPQPGRHVQDPDVVVDAMFETIRETVVFARVPIAALSLSAAMHAIVGLDEHAAPLTAMLTWADSRATEQARRLRVSDLGRQLYAATGTPVHPMSPLVKLMWFAEHDAPLFARVRRWIDLKALLLHALTGELVTELSSASGSGLLDLRARSWSDAALEVARVHRDQLPPVVDPLTELELSAAAAARLGLPAGLPVIAGAADGPLGNLGTGAIEPGIGALSLGTSGAVRAAVAQPTLDPAGRLFCYALTDDVWVVGGAVSNGASVVRWAGHMLRAYGPARTDIELVAGAESVPPGSAGLVMLPYLFGERAPLWDAELPGAYLGLRAEHDARHLVRAAIEGACRQLALVSRQLDDLVPLTSIRATGGALRSSLWSTVLASALPFPLRRLETADGTALGAAALGRCAIGADASLSEAATALIGADVGEPVEPDPEQQRIFAEYAHRIDDLLPMTERAFGATPRPRDP